MNKQNGNGNADNNGKRMAGALIVTALLAALVLLFAAYGPGSATQTASAQKISISRPAEDGTETRQPTQTEHGDHTRTPGATETEHHGTPEASRNP